MARSQGTSEDILLPRLCFAVTAFALLLFGLVMAYSASAITSISMGVDAHSYLQSQAMYAALGGAVALVVYKVVPFDAWKSNLTWLVWGGCIVLIIATVVMGTSHGGATRWLIIAGRELQPSEFAKIGFALISCKLVFDLDNGYIGLSTFAKLGFFAVIVPLGCIYVFQSDLGTSMICALCIVAVLYYSDKPLWIIIAIVIAGIVVVALACTVGYRSERFVYLDPWNDGENGFGAGYQTIHSLFALADGGMFGVGLGNSREKFLYLPANNTDYVFAVVCEELGVVGAMVVIVLFALLLYFGLRISASCPSSFGATLSAALSTMLVAQAFLNIGCAISLFPMTGKPLPFFSVGGSSMISTMIIIGFILAASRDAANESPEAKYAARRADLRVTTRVDRPQSSGRGGYDRSRAMGSSRGRR